MSNDPKEWFRLLDLNLGASLDEVKRSYRELAKVWHPDRFAHDPSLLRKSQEKMKQLNHAYQQLSTALAQSGADAFAAAAGPANPSSTRRADPPPRPASEPPPPPMAAMIKGGDGFVRLSWTPVYGFSSYNVKRSTVSGGPYTTIASGIAWTEYRDDSAANGTRYYYVLSSVDRSLESANSSELTAQPLAPPLAPTKLTATIAKGGKGVQLKWKQAASPEIIWNIVYRSTNGAPFVQIAQLNAGTSYRDTQVDPGATYVVTAVNSNAQQSAYSNAAAAPAQ